MTLIPDRNADAFSGSEFMNHNMNVPRNVREGNILQELLSGNIPNFLRNFCEVKITNGTNSITYLAMPDYLCIGSDDDYIRIPMNPLTAQQVANKYNCTLPTRKMVTDIYHHAINKLAAIPHGPPYDSTMMSSERYIWSNDKINAQIANKDKSQLTAGHKKDVVLTERLAPNNPNHRVAIFGWFNSDGSIIQQLNPKDHENTYADYAHGLRMIARDVMVNGNPMDIMEIFSHPEYCKLVSDEGILTFKSY
jgi:hypothetical protein